MELRADSYKKSPAPGFNFDLGNSGNGNVVANGGSSPSLTMPLTAAYAPRDGSAVAAAPAPTPSGAPVESLHGFFDDSYAAGQLAEDTKAKALAKSGSGALALNGENTFSGGTVISGGTLAMNNQGTIVSDQKTVNGLQANPGAAEPETEIQMFPLKYANPADVAKVLSELAANESGSQPRSQMAAPVTVTPDSRIQSVIVTAPKELMGQIEGEMSALDVPSVRDQDVYVFQTKNADPNQAAQVLQNMFGGNNARNNNANSALLNRTTSTASTAGGFGIIAGFITNFTPATLGSGEPQQRLLNIQNSAAAGTRAAGSSQYNNNGTVGNAQISVDPLTHNLVVIADKATEDQIRNVIANLDATAATPPGNVRILNATNAALNSDQWTASLTNAIAINLRRELNILDTDVQSTAPSPTLTQQQLQNYQAQQMAGEKEYIQLQTRLNELQSLQATNPAELRDILPTMFADGTLADLSTKLHQTDQGLARLKTDYGPNYPDVVRQQNLAEELNREIDARINGVMVGLSSQVKSLRASLDAVSNTVQQAIQKDQPLPKPPANAPIPQPEILTSTNAFSTFSMNVSDVSFKLAEASLQKGKMPDAASIRSEEFINAFDYRDPEAAAGQPVAFASERARYPFAQNRDLLRFSIKTAAAGRAAGRPLNLVLLLDTSGSMERADRVAIIREAMRVLAAQLHPQDTVSVVTFARTARLWADGVSGDKAGETLDRVSGITPEGGTNLEEAMRLAYQTALRHYLANGANRVVLLTDGAANLGNVDPGALKQKVESFRKQGIALDCFGIGWEDYDDTMLAELSGNGDGRYAFINSPEEAATDFAAKLAGALQVAAQDVKVQVEFNPQRVTSWRQIGYAKHQLTKEQFRDNSVLAAEVAAQEAGNALYTVEIKPDGSGPVATVYVRYKIPGTMDVEEHSWAVPYDGNAPALEQSSPAMRLAATAGAFSEWLAGSPFAQEVTPDELLRDLSGVPQIYGADQRPTELEWMIRQAKSLSGK